MLLLKNELRKKYLYVRKNIENRSEKDNGIFEKVIGCIEYINADFVFCYISAEYEPDTKKIIDYSLKNGKRVACPVCIDKSGNMQFRFIKALKDTHIGMYGIPEPDEYCEKAEFTGNSVCIVPCVCCDLRGYRIGYGKGYYDRFLSFFTGVKIILSYSDCITDSIPYEENDIKCDLVIQER